MIRRNTVGFVFQTFNLIPTLTAIENVVIPTEPTGKDKIEMTKRGIKILKGFDLEKRLKHRPSELSGGERQRIAIARAIIRDPRILVLDDASSAIDSKTEDEINRAIRNVLQNRTSFIITHRIAQIRKSDHIILMDDAKILDQGSHEHLLKSSEKYREIFSQLEDDE